MSLFKRTLDYISKRRENILSGNFNCIPLPFERFSRIWAGIEQRKYYLISANSKVGKSQITDYIFLYHAYKFCKANNIPIKIFYFSLEQDKQTKTIQAFSHFLYLEHGIRLSPEDLRSTREALDESTLAKIAAFETFFKEFEEVVEFIEDIKNPFGIYKKVRTYCEENGVVHKKVLPAKTRTFGKPKEEVEEYFDYYVPNNPKEYVLSISDHVSLLSPENGETLNQAIGKHSKYNILLRNNYGVTPVAIQQQANAQEGIENFKLGKLMPTFNGLADCKDTQRDIDVAIGLFTPHRHDIGDYQGYNIGQFKDHIRFMNIMGGREGGFGEIAPLFFDGAVNIFRELPLPNDKVNLEKVYKHIKTLSKWHKEQP